MLQTIASIVCTVLAAVCFLLRPRAVFPLFLRFPVKPLLPVLLCGLGTLCAVGILTNAILPAAPQSAADEPLWLALLLHALLPALREELVFRGVLLQICAPVGRVAAALIPSVLFALCHTGAAHMLYAFCSALLFSAVVLITGSIWYTVLLHIGNNVLTLLNAGANDLLIYVLLTLGILSAVYLFLKRKELFSVAAG